MDETLDRVRSIARSYFDDEVSPAHDWHHVRRVEATASEIAAGREDVDDRVLGPAVLLHDIGRSREDDGRIEDHAEWGANEARRILGDVGAHDDRSEVGDGADGVVFDEAAIDAVCHCIRAHRYSNDVEPGTPEARILSDADNLDALGAIGIARVFTYGGELGTTIHDPDLPPDADESTAGRTATNHARKKILSLRDRMYTDAGRKLADERHEYVVAFLDRLEANVAGER